MTEKNSVLNSKDELDIQVLSELQTRPVPFTPGEPLFWDDPHISGQMLATHLDPDTDLASRKPETIDKSVGWIMGTLDLEPGDMLLDLGCGPGLYANRFAQLGIDVTGVDYSKRSIAYARDYADMMGLEITYRYENYLDLKDEALYDAVVLIFGDYCVLDPEGRRQLLGNIHRALKPGGVFVMDVTSVHLPSHQEDKCSWYAAEAGFWRPNPHLVLENGFKYPEEMIFLDQYIVIDEDGEVTIYRNWFQDFDYDLIVDELRKNSFDVLSLWSDLTGTPFREDSEWIGVVAQKRS